MKKPSPSVVLSVAALVVATGGTSFAAAKISSADIKNDSVKSKDIKDGTLKPRDFAPSVSQSRWVLVNAQGAIEAQSGGFKVMAAYPTLTSLPSDPLGLRAYGNVYIDAGEPLTNNAIVASIALQNATDQNADTFTNGEGVGADANPEVSGEISVTRCAIPGVVECYPPDSNTSTTFVVSPRMSDGSATTTLTRKRFYVVITGDSTDR